MDTYKIIVGSAPHRERLISEIYYMGNHFAEISQEQEGGKFIIHLFAHPKNKFWECTCDEALEMIAKAKKALEDMDTPREKSDFWEY